MAVTTITDLNFYGVALLVCSISALLLRYLRHPKAKAVVNHPPGPPALPIIGHLHLLGAILSKSLQGLASRYGPIMKISIASSSAIVVSNEIFAREMLKTHEMVFVSRPHFGASDFNIYQGSEFVNAGNYSPPHKSTNSSTSGRQEIMKLVEILINSSTKSSAIDLGEELMVMTNNVICSMAMSTRCSSSADQSKEIRRLVKDVLDLAPKFSLGEMLGPLAKLDLFGYGKKLKGLLTQFDDLAEGIMVEHEEKRRESGGGEGGGERKDMMDILLEISRDERAEVKITRKDIKSFLMELFMAGTETVSVALQWTLAELINHPEVYKKLRDEITTVVGSNRLVEESDIPNLPYLQAVVKEGLRLHAPAPLVFRKAMEDCTINGYDILENSRIIFNLYAIMRDPNSWEKPTEFVPERFLTSSGTEKYYLNQVDIKGRSFNYMPFGSGRRGCPGSLLASTVKHLTVATLVQCFDWKIKGGEKLNMEEGAGLSAGMEHSIVCYPITRFNLLKNSTLTE
ncbi:cytochrome P450, family 712, subfamily A, polypeptide 1 [Actinidia rufa]|uniref:Cytochrome P450, family 712, subfamily A, polypeptide 1 n=1 Tax=Actinidia rufa TaxID=165716 RepID=A0A7J0E258_9ERIC|nr:cytochrome P450, family 712, subfamily A, polypeptide 1 [Actinidia rufa]